MERKLLFIIACCFFGLNSIVAQEAFTKIERNNIFKKELLTRENMPSEYTLYSINSQTIESQLYKVSLQRRNSTNKTTINLPTPLGIQQFSVREASVLSDELAAKFPDIKSYVGIGIDDPTATVRFSKSNAGFHAMISSTQYPLFFIDPYTKDKKISLAYLKTNTKKQDFECLVDDNQQLMHQKSQQKTAAVVHDGKLRTYRIAIAATGEYSQFHLTNQNIANTATDAVKKAAVLAAMNTTMTRVNGIFERDLGVTMQIVGNNTNLIFLDGATDNLTNNDAEVLIDESQALIDNIIGNANYDIGHTFSTGAGGLAGLGVVCLNGEKAKGVTGQPSPINDGFDVDFVGHEIGHQFGANHTQYNDCNRNNGTAVEPGSASTIMGYAGICSPNVQFAGDAYFHAVSIAEMLSFVTAIATCGVITDVGNTAPTVTAGNDFTVPKLTPFILKGTGADNNASDLLTYTWEQIDKEFGFPMSPQANSTGGPMFRSFTPTISTDRYLPALATVLSGSLSSTWEVLPSVTRNLNFALTVRDNKNATARDDVKISVDGNSGPFTVTSQTTTGTLLGNSTQTISWDVANTNSAPINSNEVAILLSVDGGLTYTTTIVSNTPNDGNEQIVLPNIQTNQARIMVKPVNNIFYSVNAATFSIDKTASVDAPTFANLSVYPNPSKGKISVNFVMNSSDEVLIELFDLRGRKIQESNFQELGTNFSRELNYQSVAKGLYILKIENGQNRISKKVIID